MKRIINRIGLTALALGVVLGFFSCNLPTAVFISTDGGTTLLVTSANFLKTDVTYTESSNTETFKSDGTYEYNVSSPNATSRKGTYTYNLETFTLSIIYTQWYNTTTSAWVTYATSETNSSKSMSVLTEKKRFPAYMYRDGVLTGRSTVTTSTIATASVPSVKTVVDTTAVWTITLTKISSAYSVLTTTGTGAAVTSSPAGITGVITNTDPSTLLAKAGDSVTYTSSTGVFEVTLIQGNVAIFSQFP